MPRRTSIKIIKRGERERPPQAVSPRASKKDGPRDPSREVASTVTGWVREFQHRRRTGLSRVEE
ncbi:MAG TPA: hypothetical protein VGB17_02405 [Pyrinomonadaceae bacterium]